MSDEPISEESKGRGLKSGLSVAGVLAAIVSVWWFALRPRRKAKGSDADA